MKLHFPSVFSVRSLGLFRKNSFLLLGSFLFHLWPLNCLLTPRAALLLWGWVSLMQSLLCSASAEEMLDTSLKPHALFFYYWSDLLIVCSLIKPIKQMELLFFGYLMIVMIVNYITHLLILCWLKIERMIRSHKRINGSFVWSRGPVYFLSFFI